MVRSILAALLSLSLGAAPALAQAQGKQSRAEIAAKLTTMFPSGHRAGQEGVMTLGGKFRTVGRHRSTWQDCRSLCRNNPATPGVGGCLLWTFVKAPDPKVPNVCRMWWELPDIRANPDAVSGRGRLN